MDKETMRKKATEILLCHVEKLEEKEIPEHRAMYYRNIDRGGGALIISYDGSLLFVDPFFVEYEEHLLKFINGERSSFE